MSQVKLNNGGSAEGNLYYPRLQVNKHGEIVLSVFKDGHGLTHGVLVGKTPDSKSKVSIGQKFSDWEVGGELVDYDGEVQVSFINKVPTEAFDEITCRGAGYAGLLTQRRALPENDPKRVPLTARIEPLVAERDEIMDRFENRTQLAGDKARLAEINVELY